MLARGEEPPCDALEIVEGADLLDVDAERRTGRDPDEGEPAGAEKLNAIAPDAWPAPRRGLPEAPVSNTISPGATRA